LPITYLRLLTNETKANPAACGKGPMNQLILSTTTEHSVSSIVPLQGKNINPSHLHHIMSTQVRSDRSLRIVTICTILPASILLIATGISTRGVLPTIGLVPMTLSTLLGVVSLASGNKGPIPYKSHMDLVLAIFLMAILVPTYVTCGTKNRVTRMRLTFVVLFRQNSWVFLTSAWNPRMAMLCSYSVMPLMVNLYVNVLLRNDGLVVLTDRL
jgi:hypothetical protein